MSYFDQYGYMHTIFNKYRSKLICGEDMLDFIIEKYNLNKEEIEKEYLEDRLKCR